MMRLSTRSLVVVGCMATALAVGCSEAGDDGSTGSARQGLDTTSSTDASPAGATGESVSVAALGSCKSSAQCDDNNPCTTDKCVGGMCRFTAKANGAKCNDANACTTSDKCASGVCQGKAVANGTACNDSNACTRTDRCRAGLCAGTNPIVCGGADQCHDNGTCDRSTGTCSPPPAKPNGSACNDGNACTQTDSCQSGACTGSNPVVCIASDQCHVPGSCDPATGVCSNPPISDGAGCVGACGLAATCRGGACVDSNPVACSSIGASGGSVELPGVADLNIPPGALTSQTTIVVHQVSAPSAGASGVMLTTAAVELEPDGLIFQTPATLTLAYDPTLLSPATAARQAIYQFAGGVLLPASPTTVDTSALTLSMPLTHFSSYVGGLAVSSPACTSLYSDGFEADSGWGMFEEIVGGNPCYASGIGAVYPSTEASAGGSSSLKVWANRTNSQYSDHVIGQKKLYDTGKSGIWKYSVAAYISPTTANTGQAGPEISMQNTRSPSPGVYLTASAGIQYRSSPFASPTANWAIWTEDSPGQASWHEFMVEPLQAGQWYTLTLVADYSSNVYQSFEISGPGLDRIIDLSTFPIAQEAKGFTEEAFWLTLEGENLWSNCGTAGPFQNIVHYDEALLSSCCDATSCPNGCCDATGQCQSCSSCPPGSVDMVDWMTLDPDLSATSRLASATGDVLYTVAEPDRFFWLKSPQGDTWDAYTFDSDYVYFAFTEQAFHSPWACKPPVDKQNWKEAKRCATPGDVIHNSNSIFELVSSAELQLTSGVQDTVFELRDAGTLSWGALGALPTLVLDYHWNCAPGGTSCTELEQFFLTQRYGLVQWARYVNGNFDTQTTYDIIESAATPHTMFSCFTPPETRRVSLTIDGTQANGPSFYSSIDGAGRFVAYTSLASNLVPNDANGTYDVFLYDGSLGTTPERISVASDGTQGNDMSILPRISRDEARYIAFESNATNLVPGDTNNTTDIFVHDRVTGQTKLISTGDAGPGNGQSNFASISADGCLVAFHSWSDNLVPDDTNGTVEAFVRDHCRGTTRRLSVTSSGGQANSWSNIPLVDDAGRFIAYTSNATNLVPTAVGSGYQAYVYDGFWGVTSECVSQALDGGPANDWVEAVAISGEDGRFVVMLGAASNLVSDDTNGVEDLFVRDRWTNTTTRVSVASDGRQASAPSRDGAISSDGRFVAFTSQAAELATGGVAGGVFLHDLWTKQTIAPRTSGGGTPDAGGFAGVAAPALSTHLVDIAGIRVTNRISLVYHSDAANIAPGDTNAASDVFTRIVTVP